LELKTLVCGMIQTNAHIIFDTTAKKALLVDCPDQSHAPVSRFLKEKGLKLTTVIITHGHWDHVSDTSLFQKEGAKVIGHPDIGEWLADPAVKTGLPFGFGAKPSRVDKTVADGETADILGIPMTFFHVPGHNPASLAIYVPSMNLCFTGDLIFQGSVGRTDLGGGDFRQLEHSIRSRIYTLPDETVLLPGHGNPTSVGEEKENNPYVSVSDGEF
jgi:glyoxylase-like metal-dependent hydrolase (beta-lactamase superfamily II)